MTTANAANGKAPARKQLSDQLDRLDSIIDALAEGLNAAVADACREGARAAVREVLMELISNPDLVAAVRASAPAATSASNDGSPTPGSPTGASFWGRVKDAARGAGRAVTGAARTLVKSVEGAVKPATDALRLTGTSYTIVAAAVGVGLAVGLVSLICPTWVSALLAAGGSVAAVGAAYVGAKIDRICARFRFSA